MFQRIILIIGAVVCAYISVTALMQPETVLSDFGLNVDGPDARNEIRAQYGGFYGMVALVMILSLFGRLTRHFGLSVLLITVGGVLLGRLASLVIEGPEIFSNYSMGLKIFILADIVLVFLAIIALRRDTPKP